MEIKTTHHRVCASLLITGFLLLLPHTGTPAPIPAATESERGPINELTSRFLVAFENLDLRAFMKCFAEDATVFFPTPEPPELFAGKPAIRRHFAQVFEGIRVGAQSGPPYHHLVPENVQIQVLGVDAAWVTFELHNSERIGRRTLVLRKSRGDWVIAHLHASNVPITHPANGTSPQ